MRIALAALRGNPASTAFYPRPGPRSTFADMAAWRMRRDAVPTSLDKFYFEDLSDKVICDDVFARLGAFPNVVITGHQGFFTEEALKSIAETTLTNITAFERGQGAMRVVSAEMVAQRKI